MYLVLLKVIYLFSHLILTIITLGRNYYDDGLVEEETKVQSHFFLSAVQLIRRVLTGTLSRPV